MDKNIAWKKSRLNTALAEWRELESQNSTMEKDILSMNDLIAKQRNRQLEVKKNEECGPSKTKSPICKARLRNRRMNRSKLC